MRISDWSSDVCSSDLEDVDCAAQPPVGRIDQAADDDAAVLVEHGCERRAARVGRQATVGLEAVGEIAIDAAQDPVLLDAQRTPYVPAIAVEVAEAAKHAGPGAVAAPFLGDGRTGRPRTAPGLTIGRPGGGSKGIKNR